MTTVERPTPEQVATLTNPFDLRSAFEARQEQLLASLKVTGQFTAHGTTIGDASEVDWIRMLRDWLPKRYGVGSIQAVDANGRQSQQIDIAVFDQHYAPRWFKTPGAVHILPVESVYAVFEVKPEINKTYADYTGDKIASVRALRRTSGRIRHLGGVATAQSHDGKDILGGVLTVRSGWADMEGRAAVDALTSRDTLHRIDVGIALDALSFDIGPDGTIEYSAPGTQLIFFTLRLFERLQAIGTALAVEVSEYERHINRSYNPST